MKRYFVDFEDNPEAYKYSTEIKKSSPEIFQARFSRNRLKIVKKCPYFCLCCGETYSTVIKKASPAILRSIFSESVGNFEKKSEKKFLEFHLVYISILKKISVTKIEVVTKS